MQARATRWLDRATSELEKYLKQTEDDLALAAIQALLQIRTQRTVEILKAACSSKKRRVAEAARDALLKLKGGQR
jgi:HEAT repeat protein